MIPKGGQWLRPGPTRSDLRGIGGAIKLSSRRSPDIKPIGGGENVMDPGRVWEGLRLSGGILHFDLLDLLGGSGLLRRDRLLLRLRLRLGHHLADLGLDDLDVAVAA
eukprot:7921223-Pyramimonas_sp.AAC.1